MNQKDPTSKKGKENLLKQLQVQHKTIEIKSINVDNEIYKLTQKIENLTDLRSKLVSKSGELKKELTELNSEIERVNQLEIQVKEKEKITLTPLQKLLRDYPMFERVEVEKIPSSIKNLYGL